MMRSDPKAWFAPKAGGYGAGLPISWKGWAAIVVFALAMAAAGVWLHGAWRIGVSAGLIVAFAVLAMNKTDGGWRWRSGPGA